jgi:bifunctional UDP-N-acetylglucosamine pyrophosphorylase/glucosamine-1-phosphate N-acetyltransferase
MKSAHAKVLHPILGRPLGYYPLRRAIEAGADPVVAVVGHQADAVQQALSAAMPGAPLAFALQEQQLGTAHAVLSARSKLRGFDGQILILYGDVPLVQTATLKALVQAKRARKAPLAIVTTEPPSPTGYGRIVREAGKATRIVEEKDCSPEQRQIREANAGLYLVDAQFLWKALSRVGQKNAQREFYLTDLVEVAVKAGRPVATVSAPFEEVAGVNDRAELAQAAARMGRRINQAHMKAGVTLLDPQRTYIEESVVLGQDVTIAPGAMLRGATRVGRGASIGVGCVLQDSTVAEEAAIKHYSLLEEAVVGRGALIGPFARLRPGTVLAENVHVGNFVETKKAHIGKGSKANHLTYLGDCEIGGGVNVGAGTITCNYDGVNKHKTVLGDGVFVGSDSQFVAPVTVGKGAFIGAGSTITEDVPPHSLAIARGRQVTKKDYLRKRRKAV